MNIFQPPTILSYLICLITCPVSLHGANLTPLTTFTDAFTNQKSNLQVKQEGTITRVLSDDTIGDRHQRIIVRLGNNQTLLIAHNIDLAPRVPNPSVGKTLRFYGEYEWNDEGGTIHWTHKDPDGSHITGWLEYEGKWYGGDAEVVRIYHGAQAPSYPAGSVMLPVDTREILYDICGKNIRETVHRQAPGIRVVRITGTWRGAIKFTGK